MPKVKLTGAILARLKAPATGQVDYFDAGYPGLALRVTAKGVRSWTYFGRLHGKLKRVTLGRLHEVPKLSEARQRAGEAAEALREGVDPAAAKRAKREALTRDTVEAVVDEWIKRDQAGNRSLPEVRRVMDHDVIPRWGARPLAKIKRRDVIELLDAIVDRGAPTLALRVHAYLHRLFRWAVMRDIIVASPMSDLPKPGRENPRDRVLDDNELARVWQACDGLDYPFGPLVRLLILTGARRDEITALRWEEVDEGLIRLAGKRTKAGEPRTIPLAPEAQAIVAGVPRIANPDTGKADFAFTSTGRTPVSGWSKAKRKLNEVVSMTGPDGQRREEVSPLADWVIHDLRRTAATGLQRLGFRLEVIEAVLGHISGSRAGIVGVYQRHAFEDEKRKALEAWARHVIGLVSPGEDNVVPLRETAGA